MLTTTPVQIRTFREATEVLSTTLPGYESRPEQERLATAIETSWRDDTLLVGQAGTGTGKSLAALIPAILSGERVIYSTATKALQAQIMQKDLPFLHDNLGVPFRYAMLQGISNYFCQAKAMDNLGEDLVRRSWEAINADTEAAKGIPANYALNGLQSDFDFEIDPRSWSSMTTTSEDCTRKKCPFYSECRFTAARDRAMAANVVVVNHALVALNAKLQEQTTKSVILGEYDRLILDEAHEFEEYVTMALTSRSNEGTFVALTNDIMAFSRLYAKDGADGAMAQAALKITPAAQTFFRTFDEGRVMHKMAMDHSEATMGILSPLGEIFEELTEGFSEDDFDSSKEKSKWVRLVRRVQNQVQALGDFLLKADSEVVRVIQVDNNRKYTNTLEIIPVNVGPWLNANLWQYVTPTLISATLLVGGKADYVTGRLGVSDLPQTLVDVGSPFDYNTNSQLYIPQHLPAPAGSTRDAWDAEVMPIMRNLIQASRGRALVLFTSTVQMRKAFDLLAPQLEFDCKKQGDLPNDALTRWFRESNDSVLFATRSFFTGIDIQGESLSMVIIDKLPFPVPTEPVFEARSEEIERKGGMPFFELSVPMMTLVLQQAFGRLIRTKSDRGVVAILDPRLKTKGYGSTICKSLPSPQVYDLNDVDRFFA